MHKQHQPKILIIEDQKSLLQAFVGKFKNQGFDVLATNNGASALLLASIQRPDMVIVDLTTPKAETVGKKLREYKWARGLPLVFLNSWEEPKVSEQNIEGIDEHLAYDSSLEQVMETVKNKLSMKKIKFN